MNRFLRFAVALIFSILSLSSVEAIAQDRAQIEKEIASLVEHLKAKEAEFLSPSAEDRAAFADFLKQPDAGLIRLLPREKYREKLIIREGGAYYSFIRLTHEYGYGTDILLENGRFSVGSNFGFLTNLGQIPLEEVTLAHPGVRFLAESSEPEIRERHSLSRKGFEVGNFKYFESVPAEANSTYALRSVNLRRSDVLIVFRVVRQDTDSSQIILWKLLNKFSTPSPNRASRASNVENRIIAQQEQIKTGRMLKRQKVDGIDNYPLAAFSFEFGGNGLDVQRLCRNDWDILFGNSPSGDTFDVTMVTDDRSRIKDIGKLNWDDRFVIPRLVAYEEPEREPSVKAIEGHLYLVHTRDTETNLYTLFRVEKLVPGESVDIT